MAVMNQPQSCKELLEITANTPMPIHLRNGVEVFGSISEEFVLYDSMITTLYDIDKSEGSCQAVLESDGMVRRYKKEIATWRDITLIEE